MSYFLEKRTSPIHGLGIFTTRDIKAGEEFYYIPMGSVINNNFFRYAYVGSNRYVNDENVLNWVNHSCNANTYLMIDRPDPVLVAKVDILVGDEVVCNYSRTEIKGCKFDCNCNETKCNHKIGKK
jgi:SET domain-containing protein